MNELINIQSLIKHFLIIVTIGIYIKFVDGEMKVIIITISVIELLITVTLYRCVTF